MIALASSKHRFKCPTCDRIVDRKSRQQIFCSTRCRNRAHKTPWTLKTPVRYPCSEEGMDPHKFSNENNILQWRKRGSSLSCKGVIGPRRVINVEVITGREWQEIVSSDSVKSYVSHLGKRALVERGGI